MPSLCTVVETHVVVNNVSILSFDTQTQQLVPLHCCRATNISYYSQQ